MGYARLRGRDGGDLARIQMNAMAEHRTRGQHSAFLVDVGVIARAHVKVMDLLELFAVLGQVRLQICLQPGRELGRAAHHFFRTRDREARTERVLEPAFFGAMPFPAKAFAFQK